MLSLLFALIADMTKESAERCLLVLMSLGGALGAISYLGRNTNWDEGNR